MSYYFVLPLVLTLFPAGTNAGIFDHEKCFDEHHQQITCPSRSDTQKIVAIAVPLGILVLLIAGLVIHRCLKKRRARRTFVNLDVPAPTVPPYVVGASNSQMEQGYGGQWAPPPQNQSQSYAPPPGPPPGLAHSGSYNTGDPEKHGY